uniref:Endolytic peptidoglycan transglycosylase RlpA n=1 Tax=Candidatus Kentrum sp. FM TaxID=2126340 RepID=A0A450SW17_9GAMM|nr:MAG: rare lipoprotein A [Candidatus Kentron sp. FM]VFJ62986.1 MAG: rare lipoprotein A [Candidatus Kentron sp. FM]VFK19661.1 MAG: rare lipoprotein A [Candidatus Kentron sp. FM]
MTNNLESVVVQSINHFSSSIAGKNSAQLAKAVFACCLMSLLAGCGFLSDQDGPPLFSRLDPDNIPDAVPRSDPKSPYGNPPSYAVYGQRYYVMESSLGYVKRGIASWYGRKFHGRRTSSGETYDMFAMTAAHRSLPLPTYVRVINLENGRQAIVRVNDRGPFHPDRIIDLSYAAAVKLHIAQRGTARVEIRAIDPTGPKEITQARLSDRSVPASAPTQGGP